MRDKKEFEITHSELEQKMKKEFINHIQLSRFSSKEKAQSATFEQLQKKNNPQHWARFMNDFWVIENKEEDTVFIDLVGYEELNLHPYYQKNRGYYGSRVKIIPDLTLNTGGSVSAVLEYDGWFWHKEKTNKDVKKTKILITNGIKVIRFRETPLERINLQDEKMSKKLLQISFDPKTDSFDNYIDPVFDFLKGR